jgi:hypothetical protein
MPGLGEFRSSRPTEEPWNGFRQQFAEGFGPMTEKEYLAPALVDVLISAPIERRERPIRQPLCDGGHSSGRGYARPIWSRQNAWPATGQANDRQSHCPCLGDRQRRIVVKARKEKDIGLTHHASEFRSTNPTSELGSIQKTQALRQATEAGFVGAGPTDN